MQRLARAGAELLKAYYRHVPFMVGKRAIWNHVAQPLMRRFPLSLEARTWFGARMLVQFPDTIQGYVYFFGMWEPAITAYLTAMLRPGDVVIDIGANIGYDTLLAALCVGPTGHVHAIEASPRLFGLLEDNLALNEIMNVTALNAAVCGVAGPVDVFLHDDCNLGGTTIMPDVARRRNVSLEACVRGAPLPALISEGEILRSRLIKIDVEGAEWPVVQGFADLLPRLSPRTELLIEVSAEALHDHQMTPASFIDVFRSAGFQPFVICNKYCVDMYLAPAVPLVEPLAETDFEQLDILFRRV